MRFLNLTRHDVCWLLAGSLALVASPTPPRIEGPNSVSNLWGQTVAVDFRVVGSDSNQTLTLQPGPGGLPPHSQLGPLSGTNAFIARFTWRPPGPGESLLAFEAHTSQFPDARAEHYLRVLVAAPHPAPVTEHIMVYAAEERLRTGRYFRGGPVIRDVTPHQRLWSVRMESSLGLSGQPGIRTTYPGIALDAPPPVAPFRLPPSATLAFALRPPVPSHPGTLGFWDGRGEVEFRPATPACTITYWNGNRLHPRHAVAGAHHLPAATNGFVLAETEPDGTMRGSHTHMEATLSSAASPGVYSAAWTFHCDAMISPPIILLYGWGVDSNTVARAAHAFD